MKIKAISLWQPWASLIAVGAKKYETRSWATSYRGPLLICAAKGGLSKQNFFTIVLASPAMRDALRPLLDYPPELELNSYLWAHRLERDLPFGKAAAVVDLTDCIQTELFKRGHPEFLREVSLGDFSSGRYAWKLENVRAIEPFPVKGRQRLFEVELSEELLRRTP
jgi:activating signal cointegrator 1